MRGTAKARLPPLSGMMIACVTGAKPSARTSSFAGPGASSFNEKVPSVPVRARRTPRSV
jgi:hypothetical protein